MSTYKPSQELKEFENDFNTLIDVELYLNSPECKEPIAASYLCKEYTEVLVDNSRIREQTVTKNDRLFFVKTLGTPFLTNDSIKKLNIIKNNDLDLYEKSLIEKTILKIISNKSSKTELSEAISIYYLVQIGINLQFFTREYLEENIANILLHLKMKYSKCLINWDYLESFYPSLHDIKHSVNEIIFSRDPNYAYAIFND